QGKESVLVRYRVEEDAATLAAVAAVGTAPRHVGLPSEAHAAASPVSTLDEDLDPIDEHRSTALRPPARRGGGRRAWLRRRGDDAHAQTAGAVVLEADDALRPGEEGMVLAQAHVLARLPLRAVLADQDGAALDPFPAVALDAETLGVAVPPVAAGTLSPLVRHAPTSQKHWSGAGGSRGRSGRRLVCRRLRSRWRRSSGRYRTAGGPSCADSASASCT